MTNYSLVSAFGLNIAARAAGKLYFGTATQSDEFNDTAYMDLLNDLKVFGQLTPRKAMKWEPTEPERGVFTFEQGDQIVALAKQDGKLVRGHNCVWYNEIPAWVTNTTWTAPELADIVQEHCFNIVHHWKDKICTLIFLNGAWRVYTHPHPLSDSWDVINEPFNDDGTWRETIWFNTLNTTYIPLALHAARAADPRTKLYINEYNITGSGPKADSMKTLVRDLKRAGVPVHGVGIQAHEVVGETPAFVDMKRNFEEFVELGVEVAITELDVRFVELPPDEKGLEQQKRDYEAIVRACAEVDGCVGITVWDFTDKYSWVPGTFPGMGDACPWDENLERKPAFFGILDGLAHK